MNKLTKGFTFIEEIPKKPWYITKKRWFKLLKELKIGIYPENLHNILNNIKEIQMGILNKEVIMADTFEEMERKARFVDEEHDKRLRKYEYCEKCSSWYNKFIFHECKGEDYEYNE